MASLHTVVIDDEQNARTSLTASLKRYCPDVVVTGEADGVQTGYELIRSLHPDLIFLDIKLGDGTGFDLLKKLDPADYRIIFVTAYDDYAIRAFKYNAVDYLLKPVDPDELKEAVERAGNYWGGEQDAQRYNGLLQQMEDVVAAPQRLALRTQKTIHFVPVDKIIRCQAEEGYTRFFVEGNNPLLVCHPLQDYEELLSGSGFYRIHQSHLINNSHVRLFDKVKRIFVMSNGDAVPLSSRRGDILGKILEGM